MPKYAVSVTQHFIDFIGLDPTYLSIEIAFSRVGAAGMVMRRILVEADLDIWDDYHSGDKDLPKRIAEKDVKLPKAAFKVICGSYWANHLELRRKTKEENQDYDFWCDDQDGRTGSTFGLQVLRID